MISTSYVKWNCYWWYSCVFISMVKQENMVQFINVLKQLIKLRILKKSQGKVLYLNSTVINSGQVC